MESAKGMKIYSEVGLRHFEFWSGAVCNAEQLTDRQFDCIESILEDMYPEGVDATFINDLFWFDFETVVEWFYVCLHLSQVFVCIFPCGNTYGVFSLRFLLIKIVLISHNDYLSFLLMYVEVGLWQAPIVQTEANLCKDRGEVAAV